MGYRTASKEAYDAFCKKNPKIELSFDNYKLIIYTYNKKIGDYLLETGEIIKLPFGLGSLVINKYKPKSTKITAAGNEMPNLSINWQETKKLGKYVYYLNAHTEGYKYYFMWDYHKARIKYPYIWKFEMCRIHSRKLKDNLKLPKGEYKNIYKELLKVR